MGLESVELVLDVERRFAVRLPNRELQDAVTVGRLYDVLLRCIAEQSPPDPQDRCCITCGYSLRGLSSYRCPECGMPFDPRDPGYADAMWEILVDLVAKQTSVDHGTIRRETHFVQDLDF